MTLVQFLAVFLISHIIVAMIMRYLFKTKKRKSLVSGTWFNFAFEIGSAGVAALIACIIALVYQHSLGGVIPTFIPSLTGYAVVMGTMGISGAIYTSKAKAE